jgi:8-oxo-dGTP pyrophosphatase MutT (NUDIX family)
MSVSLTIGVVVVVQREGRYLMIRRAAGVVAPGTWCFVGGAVEPGESQAQAAVREFREEVGGNVRPVRAVWEYLRSDGRLRLHYWLADLLSHDLRANPAEVAEMRWCRLPEILTLPDLLPSNREFVPFLIAQSGT